MLDLFSQRRQNIASQVKDILATRGPLPAYKREALDSMLREASDLEAGISTEHERHKLDSFNMFLRTGRDHNNLLQRSTAHFEFRDLNEAGQGTGAATGAGALVPVSFSGMVDAALRLVGPMVDSNVVTIDDTEHGRNLARPSDNDTAISGELLGEGQQTQMQDVPILGQQILGAYKIGSRIVKVSNELLEDAGFDFPAYMARKFGLRIGRALNPLFTTGTGTNEPKGICTSITAQGNTVAAIGDGSPQFPNAVDFAALEQSVDPIYRSNAIFQVHQTTLNYLRGVTDSVGNPVFKQLHSDNIEEDYVFGYPVKINNALDSMPLTFASPPATYRVAVFGDFKQFRVRRVTPIVYRLVERFAEFGQTAFLMLQRFDCALCDGGGGAVKMLTSTY